MTAKEPKLRLSTVRPFALPPAIPAAKRLSVRPPKPLRRWSVAELVARAAVRRPTTA